MNAMDKVIVVAVHGACHDEWVVLDGIFCGCGSGAVFHEKNGLYLASQFGARVELTCETGVPPALVGGVKVSWFDEYVELVVHGIHSSVQMVCLRVQLIRWVVLVGIDLSRFCVQ